MVNEKRKELEEGKVMGKRSPRTSQEERIQEVLPEGLKVELLPKHVAIILDGNRRWAIEKGMTVMRGHSAGRRRMMELTFLSAKWGIKVLSLYAFSTENWTRPQEEVDFLMNEFVDGIVTHEQDFVRFNFRVSFIGDRTKLAGRLPALMDVLEEKTSSNKGLHLILAINYSGRYDMIQATKSIANKVKEGTLELDDINKSLFHKELQTNCTKFQSPDILIRTSGEQRISNFMLWQLNNTELYFCSKKFPEFEEDDYAEALRSYQKRRSHFNREAIDH